VQKTPNHRLLRNSEVSPPLLVIDLRTTTASDPIMELVYLFVLLSSGRGAIVEELQLALEVMQKKLLKA
ncbi:hypothetical protein PIB30_057047, partial [Stylosanthes scabra]|nr:hypothetical protein [Stylosanthes scabra]